MKVNDWLVESRQELSAAGIDSWHLDSLLIAERVLDLPREQLIINQDEISSQQLKELDKILQRRLSREPLAYIFGQREFYGLEFKVSSSVLVPRPETEVMVEYLIEHAGKSATVLEIGTGSGAISVATKTLRPDLKFTATDISAGALKIAKDNAQNHRAEIDFINTDLFTGLDQKFDIIAANLPYVPLRARRQPEITFEPDIALYSGEDGLDAYRKFFTQLKSHLNKKGWLIIEASPTQFEALRGLAAAESLRLQAVSEYIFAGHPDSQPTG